MLLRYYDDTVGFDADDEERYKTYEVFCHKCNGNNIIDIGEEQKYIDGLCSVEITFKCEDCNTEFIECNIDLEIEEY